MKNISLSKKDKLTIFRSLSIMITSGIPILETLDSLIEESKGKQKAVLMQIREDISQGKTLASALEKFPNSFDTVTTNLLKAADEAGTLETNLKDIVMNIKKEIEFDDRVKTALTYPVLVLIVFFTVLLVILIFVIPRLANVFKRLKVTLPLPTQILIATSTFLTSYYPFIIIFLALTLLLSYYFYKKEKRALLNGLYSLPLLSGLARKIDFARFTRSTALLLNAGIPITEALDLSQNVLTKKEIIAVVEKAKSMVASGKKLSEAFQGYKKIIPQVIIRLTEAGEKSGTLEKTMQELSEELEIEVFNNLTTLTTLLEPILLVVIGLLVGGMMLSIIAPIYQLIGSITPR